MNLINKKLLQQKIHSFEFPSPEKLVKAKSLLEGWQKALKDSDLEKTKEKSVQGKFLSTFFEDILGYSDVTTGNEEYTLIQHPRIENDSKEPDGSLGWFTKDKKITKAVIELKDAKTQLDKKQNRGSEKLTPVEQAYLYSTKYGGCNWIIVSNFKEIRVYNKHKTQEYYEKFDVMDLTQDSELKKFYFLLSQSNLISKDKESIIDILAQDTTEAEQDITKKFYAQYKQIRLELLGHLTANNPNVSKEVLIEKTQKLLDRFIFTLFCEDTSTLLPLNLVKNTYERAINSLSPSDERVWTEFKGLFLAIDKGNDRVKPPINAYNGGLFAFDEVLDNLSIKDTFWINLMHLAEYDFETDLNVNILGHIFEQSISDLEEIKMKFLNVYENTNNGDIITTPQDLFVEKKGRRKKEGIFYTPEYITRYIVENTIGKYLEEHPDKLETIKILDPACGSGAFLNQAHSYLVKEYTNRYEALINEKLEKGESITLFDHNPAENNRKILLNNLYGVDLNQESVEITKLALWLKTARSTEPLQNLDKNIKNGNSLIDDSKIAGKKAFNWNTEFSEIMEDGGFDVIIGNPPYVNVEKIDLSDRDFLMNNYQFIKGRFDLYIAFIEKSINLLKEDGFLSFIIPYPFIYEKYASLLREHLAKNTQIQILLDLSNIKVFADAAVRSTIFVIRKTKPNNNTVNIQESTIAEIFTTKFHLKQDIFLENPNFNFKSEANEITIPILKKLESNSNELSEIYYINWGLRTGNIQKYTYKHSRNEKNEKKMINGRNIGRYRINYENDYLLYNKEELYNPMFPELFENIKIFIPDISGKYGIRAALDVNNYYAEHTVSVLVKKDKLINAKRNGKPIIKKDELIKAKEFSDYYFLSLLNSKLINFYFKIKFGGGLHVYPKDISSLPVKLDPNLNNLLTEKATVLQEKTQEYFELVTHITQFLKKEFNIKIDSNKLGWNYIMEFVDKKQIEISIHHKEELFSWFKEKQSELERLHSQIKSLENQIDQEVYKLYALTEDEIKIIEDTL